jgi:hypothetical protein
VIQITVDKNVTAVRRGEMQITGKEILEIMSSPLKTTNRSDQNVGEFSSSGRTLLENYIMIPTQLQHSIQYQSPKITDSKRHIPSPPPSPCKSPVKKSTITRIGQLPLAMGQRRERDEHPSFSYIPSLLQARPESSKPSLNQLSPKRISKQSDLTLHENDESSSPFTFSEEKSELIQHGIDKVISNQKMTGAEKVITEVVNESGNLVHEKSGIANKGGVDNKLNSNKDSKLTTVETLKTVKQKVQFIDDIAKQVKDKFTGNPEGKQEERQMSPKILPEKLSENENKEDRNIINESSKTTVIKEPSSDPIPVPHSSTLDTSPLSTVKLIADIKEIKEIKEVKKKQSSEPYISLLSMLSIRVRCYAEKAKELSAGALKAKSAWGMGFAITDPFGVKDGDCSDSQEFPQDSGEFCFLLQILFVFEITN